MPTFVRFMIDAPGLPAAAANPPGGCARLRPKAEVLVRVWTKVLVAEVTLIEGLREKSKSVVPP